MVKQKILSPEQARLNDEMVTEFALALLMPKDKFETAVKRHTTKNGNKVNIKKVANEFHVTPDMAHLRAVSLNLVQNW